MVLTWLLKDPSRTWIEEAALSLLSCLNVRVISSLLQRVRGGDIELRGEGAEKMESWVKHSTRWPHLLSLGTLCVISPLEIVQQAQRAHPGLSMQRFAKTIQERTMRTRAPPRNLNVKEGEWGPKVVRNAMAHANLRLDEDNGLVRIWNIEPRGRTRNNFEATLPFRDFLDWLVELCDDLIDAVQAFLPCFVCGAPAGWVDGSKRFCQAHRPQQSSASQPNKIQPKRRRRRRKSGKR
jgi:hypothetical protein